MNFNYSGIYFTYSGRINSDNKLEELDIYKNSSSLYISDIVLGRVSSKLVGSNAYIVDLGSYGKGFLPKSSSLSIFNDDIKLGENYLFQVSQLERGGKLPKLKADFSLNSENFVILTDSLKTVFSSKITDDVFKTELRELITDVVFDRCGVLVRTSAYDVNKEDLERELRELYSKYDLIIASKSRILKDKLLYRKITIDENHHNIDNLSNFLLRTELENRLKSEVVLDSGIRITIEQLEALVAVDVDTSNYDENYKSADEFYYKANLAVLPHVLKEIYFRNCSGIILIDLLKMSGQYRKQFMSEIKKNYSHYKSMNFDIKGFTRLGLLEMSRRRTNPSVKEMLGSGFSNKLNFNALMDMIALEIVSNTSDNRYLISLPDKYKDIFVKDRLQIREFFKKHNSRVYYRFTKSEIMTFDYTNTIFSEDYGEISSL